MITKNNTNISFIMPAFNCENTVRESVESIMLGNFCNDDELVIVNDCSTDDSLKIIEELRSQFPQIKIISHNRNKGGGAARNTAVENVSNNFIFCLDSDNILVPGSIQKLKEFMENFGADVAAFHELHYFNERKGEITHKWRFNSGLINFSDCLAGPIVPCSSGNYMFTKNSWLRAGGYPEFSGALDAWGFGFRQLATGSKMFVMPDSFYYHRYGHESYWVRDSSKGKISLKALQIILPLFELLNDKDLNYIMSPKGRNSWFDDLEKHPVRLKTGLKGKNGVLITRSEATIKNKSVWYSLQSLLK